jgi:predicted RNA binding protein YcfA (HicA-like mRNA interferase family)
MSKLPVISGKDLAKALQKAGFIILRQKGSHVSMEKREGDSVWKSCPCIARFGQGRCTTY